MSTTNISVLRKNLFTTVENVIDYNEIVVVNTKKGNVVIISEEDYKSFTETLFLTSVPGLTKKIKEGEKEDMKKMPSYNPNEEW